MDSERASGREMQAQTPPSGPTLCRTGCGFYAHSAFDGMCSKCYKDHAANTLNSSATSSSSTSSPPLLAKASTSSDTSVVSNDTALQDVTVSDAVTESDSTASALTAAESAVEPCNSNVTVNKDTSEHITGAIAGISLEDCSSGKDRPKKKRCDSCRKRVGLTGFDCRCGGQFCSVHRYSDMHECSFDYRQLAQSEIRKHNPVVAAEKITKI